MCNFLQEEKKNRIITLPNFKDYKSYYNQKNEVLTPKETQTSETELKSHK